MGDAERSNALFVDQPSECEIPPPQFWRCSSRQTPVTIVRSRPGIVNLDSSRVYISDSRVVDEHGSPRFGG